MSAPNYEAMTRDELIAQLQTCRAYALDKQREASTLRRELDRTLAILRRPNKKLAAQERIDAALAPFLYRELLCGGDSYIPLDAERELHEGCTLPVARYQRWHFADRDGSTPDTVSATIAGLVSAGALRKDEQIAYSSQPTKSGGLRRTREVLTSFAPTWDLLNRPSRIGRPDEAERNHGGKREPTLCPECGGVHLRRETRTHVRVFCEDCSRVIEEFDDETQIERVNPDIDRVDAQGPQDDTPPTPTVQVRQVDAPGTAPEDPEPEPEPEPTPIRPVAQEPAALTPAWVLGEDWYDPTRPDDGLSQLLAWGLYEDVEQATAWYQARGIYGAFQRNNAVLSVTGRGGLKPVDFVLYLRELYERGDYKQLTQIMRHRGGDPDRIRPLLEDFGDPVDDDDAGEAMA